MDVEKVSGTAQLRPVRSLRGAQTRRLPSSLRSSVQTTPRRSHSLPQPPPSARFAALRRAAFPPRCAPQSRQRRAAPTRSLNTPRPLASRRSDAPPSLLAALLSPDDAAPLPLAPSAVRQM